MKSIFIAASAIALLSPVPAMAEWIPIGVLNSGPEVYVNDQTFVYRNDTVGFWQRYVYPVPSKTGVIGADSYVSLNCRTANIQINRAVGYNSNSQVVFDITKPSLPLVIKAGSLNADIYDYACR